jgi:hypothetical protein
MERYGRLSGQGVGGGNSDYCLLVTGLLLARLSFRIECCVILTPPVILSAAKNPLRIKETTCHQTISSSASLQDSFSPVRHELHTSVRPELVEGSLSKDEPLPSFPHPHCHSRPSLIYFYKSVERESRDFLFRVNLLCNSVNILTHSQIFNLSFFRLPSLDKGREKLKNRIIWRSWLRF